MAFTFVQSDFEAATASANSIAQALTGVGAGNLIVAWVKHEGAVTGITVADDLSNALTPATKTSHANGALHGQFFYLLSATSGTRTYTASLGASREFRSIIVFEFDYAEVCTFDAEAGSSGTTSGEATISSGNLTTSGADTLMLGGYGEYSSQVTNTERCNDLAADGVVRTSAQANFTVAWRRVMSGTFTGDADCVLPGAEAWLLRAIAFKDAAASVDKVPSMARQSKARFERQLRY